MARREPASTAEDQPERAPARRPACSTSSPTAPDGQTSSTTGSSRTASCSQSQLGRLDDAEVTLTTGYADAVKIQQGELDANAAFMQGKVKVTGNMAKVMSLLPITNSPEYKSSRPRSRPYRVEDSARLGAVPGGVSQG